MENETEVTAPKRGPGRPPREAAPAPAPVPEFVTVTLLKGYVPHDSKPDANDRHQKRLPGEKLTVPVRTAMYLCSHGVAKMELHDG